MRLIDGDALYEQLKFDEELARNRVLDTESTLPYHNNLNPSYTRYVAQMDERTRLKHMIADAPTIMDEISSDGTLTVTVPKGTHVGRVLVQEDGTQYGGLFYPDEDRKRGKWIKTISENGITSAVRCSECGFEDNRYMLFRYCPHCGADMRGGQNE